MTAFHYDAMSGGTVCFARLPNARLRYHDQDSQTALPLGKVTESGFEQVAGTL